jgi:hypothetical protein
MNFSAMVSGEWKLGMKLLWLIERVENFADFKGFRQNAAWNFFGEIFNGPKFKSNCGSRLCSRFVLNFFRSVIREFQFNTLVMDFYKLSQEDFHVLEEKITESKDVLLKKDKASDNQRSELPLKLIISF